jgi:phosphocarrier protein HPr
VRAAASVTLSHPTGLHARPAVKLTKLAKTFPATISLRAAPDGTWVDAKSIVKVMALKLRPGRSIELAAEGVDAPAAIDGLRSLVARNFDEDG